MGSEVYVSKVGARTVKNDDGTTEEAPEVSYSAEYDFGADLKELCKKVGNDDTVFKAAKAQFIIGLRRITRAAGEAEGSTPKSIQERVDKWVPSIVTRVPKDPVQQALSAITGMTEEQKAALKAALADDL